MIESHLKNQSQKVVLQNVSFDWIHLYQGVLQETILGPLPFNLCVNCMINTITKLLNALAVSHIRHPAILFNGISQNLITSLEKQLSWAEEACFNRNKSDSSSDLKIKHSIFSIKLMLEYRSVTYFWKYRNSLLPAFKTSLKLPNSNFKYLPRSETLMNKTKTNSEYLRNSFFNLVIPLWNKIATKLLNPKFSYSSRKMNLRHHFRRRIPFEFENPDYTKKCWRDYRFN